MGGSQSFDKIPCQTCGGKLAGAKLNNLGMCHCLRCGTIYSAQNNNGSRNSRDIRLVRSVAPLRRLCYQPLSRPRGERNPAEESEEKREADWQERSLRAALEQARSIEAGMIVDIEEGIRFKITSCYPPFGALAPSTVFFHAPATLPHGELTRIHLLPTAVSLTALGREVLPNRVFDEYLRDYFTASRSHPLHLSPGQSFVSNGLQFKVIACEPEDGGFFGPGTEIFTEGDPVAEVGKVRILPIAETLPEEQRQLQGPDIIRPYLEPYFSLQSPVLAPGQIFTVHGGRVQFRVFECEPEGGGMVTNDSLIYNDSPAITQAELRRRQEEEDERVAREIQQQEVANDPLHNFMRQLRSHHAARTYGGGESPVDLLNLLLQMQAMQAAGDGHFGTPAADRSVLASLPRVTIDQEHKDQGQACSVCMSDFEVGESPIVELPCKHLFHEPCITPWLTDHCSCPTCRFELKSSDPEFERNKAMRRAQQLMRDRARGSRSTRQASSSSSSSSSSSRTTSSRSHTSTSTSSRNRTAAAATSTTTATATSTTVRSSTATGRGTANNATTTGTTTGTAIATAMAIPVETGDTTEGGNEPRRTDQRSSSGRPRTTVEWPCARCTYHNRAGKNHCRMCGCPAPSAAFLPLAPNIETSTNTVNSPAVVSDSDLSGFDSTSPLPSTQPRVGQNLNLFSATGRIGVHDMKQYLSEVVGLDVLGEWERPELVETFVAHLDVATMKTMLAVRGLDSTSDNPEVLIQQVRRLL